MSRSALHQFLTGATAGDAITGQALLIRDWLCDLGFESQIFALYVHESVAGEIQPLSTYRITADESWAIYHHSIGSPVPEYLSRQALTLLLIYHNITPADYFTRVDPQRADLARQGLEQLGLLRNQTELAVAVSEYNRSDLTAAGYQTTAVLPVTLRADRLEQPVNEPVAASMRKTGPNLLFVGRFAPNKKQEDLIKLMAYVKRIYPGAMLYLVGSRWEVGYDLYIEQMAIGLGLEDSVVLTGKVSHQDLLTYYRTADLYVSMSEHEGFGMPFIESMYCGLPVMAYGAAAAPETLDTAGIVFTEKRYPELAELLDIILTDDAFRSRIIAGQSERVQAFLEPQVRSKFEETLRKIEVLKSSAIN